MLFFWVKIIVAQRQPRCLEKMSLILHSHPTQPPKQPPRRSKWHARRVWSSVYRRDSRHGTRSQKRQTQEQSMPERPRSSRLPSWAWAPPPEVRRPLGLERRHRQDMEHHTTTTHTHTAQDKTRRDDSTEQHPRAIPMPSSLSRRRERLGEQASLHRVHPQSTEAASTPPQLTYNAAAYRAPTMT